MQLDTQSVRAGYLAGRRSMQAQTESEAEALRVQIERERRLIREQIATVQAGIAHDWPRCDRNWNAASFEALEHRCQQVAGGTLDDSLGKSAKPTAVVRPFAVGIVLEQNVRISALELAQDEAGFGIGEAPIGRQRQREVAVGEFGYDLAGGEWLPSSNCNANCACEVVPEGRRLRMRLSPSMDVGENLSVGTGIAVGDAAPSANTAAKSAS